MAIKTTSNKKFTVEIGVEEGKEGGSDKTARLNAFIKAESAKRSPQMKLKIELSAIRYKIEEYLDDEKIARRRHFTIQDFVSIYLKTLNISFKKFAISIDTTDGNLKKYLSGSRKFNIDLAMKFGRFFHTPPDIWLRVQLKNDLRKLKVAKTSRRYAKYDFEKVL
jgi:plasmid maintenance system antidote protein VapI